MIPRCNPVRTLGWLTVVTTVAFRPAHGQSRVEYKYEYYQEDDQRTKVETQGLWFESELHPKFTLRGQYVHDALSGATPTGGPPPVGSNVVPLTHFSDERNAGYVEGAVKLGRTTTTPQIAYSEESDYRSLGLALTEAIDFNQKNTTLITGLSRNSDSLNGANQLNFVYKNDTTVLVGLNQLLTPLSVLSVNLSFGYQDGYLNDPYKGVNFAFTYLPDSPFNPTPEDVNLEEKRPRHKFKQVGYIGFTQNVPVLKGSADFSYRLHHDDWGIWANTFGVEWNQKIGSRVVLTPLFRYHRQSAANFYGVRFAGDPLLPAGGQYAIQSDGSLMFLGDPGFPGDGSALGIPAHPTYFSSDYRLSEMETFTYGVGLRIKVCEHASLYLAYKRYEMHGLDGVTPRGQYPSAHAGTVGLGIEF